MDADAVRTVAMRVRGLADQVSRLAVTATGASADGWQSTAATGWRQRLSAEVAALHRLCGLIDDAAAELVRHAAGCQR